MIIEIDLTRVPVEARLRESDDLRRLSAEVATSENLLIAPEELRRLAGDQDHDPEWRGQFEAMVAYATDKGWVANDGRIQVHIDHLRR